MNVCREADNFINDFVQILQVVLEITRRWFEFPAHGFATVCDHIYSCASHLIQFISCKFWLSSRYICVYDLHCIGL